LRFTAGAFTAQVNSELARKRSAVKLISIVVSLVFVTAWGVTGQRHGSRGTAPESAENPQTPELETVFYMQGNQLGVALKKR
jgi:hypothetical protein